MSPRLSRRRTAIAVASAAAVIGATLFTGTATAATSAEPVSTPVPIVTPDGMLMSYILNTAKAGNPGQVQVLSNAVRKAGGVVVQSWPEIGVVVAHSDRAAFRTNVAASAGAALESVGATRTVSVSEDTPEGLGATWAPGASSYKKGAKKDYNGDLPAEETPATAVDPREVEQWDMRMIKADQAHDDHRRLAQRPRRRPRQRHRPRPPGPRRQHRRRRTRSTAPTPVARTCRRPGWYPQAPAYHGTHVAGTIAAARNGVGIVGVAPNVRMASVKVVNDAGFIYPEYAVCGFVWSGLKHMDVTNNSYYVDPFMYYCEDQPDQYAAKEAVRRAVAWSTDQGVVHAAAAGNAATDLSNNTTDTTSPDDGTPVVRTINSGCEDIPTELARRRDGVVDAAVPGGHDGQPAVELQQPRARRHRRRGSGLERSSRRSSDTATATDSRAARRWRPRTSPACWP